MVFVLYRIPDGQKFRGLPSPPQASDASKPAFSICILTLSGFLSLRGRSYRSFPESSSATRWREFTQEKVLPSAEEKGAESWAGLLRGKTRRTVMLYASSADG